MAKNSGFPMGGVEDTGVEAALPKVAGGPLEGVAIFGILAVQVHHETGNGLAAITDGDEMEVIAEEDISGDAHVPFFTAVSTRVRKCWRSARRVPFRTDHGPEPPTPPSDPTVSSTHGGADGMVFLALFTAL